MIFKEEENKIILRGTMKRWNGSTLQIYNTKTVFRVNCSFQIRESL